MYFIYRHIRLDNNTPFYIGKGTIINGAKSFKKEYTRAYSKQGRNKYWNNIANSFGYEVEIIFSSDNEVEIFNKETEFIKLYGRKDLGTGILVNMSFGGEGENGRIFSDIHKKRLSDSKKGISTATEYSRAVASELSKGKNNYFYGKKLKGESNGFYGKKHSKEVIEGLKGVNNPMYGKRGELNPFYGKTHTKEFLRRKQIQQSNKVKMIKDGVEIIFECLKDCADFVGCTVENLRSRDKANKLGKKPKTGMFVDVYIEILK